MCERAEREREAKKEIEKSSRCLGSRSKSETKVTKKKFRRRRTMSLFFPLFSFLLHHKEQRPSLLHAFESTPVCSLSLPLHRRLQAAPSRAAAEAKKQGEQEREREMAAPPPHGGPSTFAPPPPPQQQMPSQLQQEPVGMGLDPATALPTTDTIQAVSSKDGKKEGERLNAFFPFFIVHLPFFGSTSTSTSTTSHLLSPSSFFLLHTHQFLEDNDRLIGAVSQAYGSGRLDAAAAYQARLHANLTYLAAVADASTPSSSSSASAGGEAGGAAAAPPPQPQARSAPPVPQQQQQQRQQQQFYQQQGGAPPPPPPPRQF